jgi:hypothetical protein
VSDRRARLVVLALLVLAAAALWGAARTVPAAGSLAWVSLAVVAAVVALSGVVRRALGVLVLGLAAWSAWLGVNVFALVAAVLLASAGVVLLLRGHRMPAMTTGTPDRAERAAVNSLDPWQRLSEGDDPTADPGDRARDD